MPLVNARVNHQPAARALREVGAMLPYVAATFLTRVAKRAEYDLAMGISRAFKDPTPYTRARVRSTQASKNALRAMVGIPDSPEQSGRSTSEYMRPGALGTPSRHQKKSEYLLSSMGYLPPGWVMVPGSYMKGRLDGYGNVPGSYYKQIIRDLQIKNTKGPPKPRFGAAQRRAERMGVGAEFFAVGRGRNTLNKGGGWLPPGVYRRVGRKGEALQQYFVFVPRAKYEKRLDLPMVARETLKLDGPALWKQSMADVAARFATRGRSQ
jgi:hypothetical protein